MNENKTIKRVQESLRFRQKLKSVGICSLVGPTGPRGIAGTSINIKGNYASFDELKNEHPEGNLGDAYLVNGNLYLWNDDNMLWENVGNIKGPKGDKGDVGPTGPKGDTGLKGDIGPRGIDGIQGPKGDKGGIDAFGEKYLHTNKTISIKQFVDTVIPLDDNNASFNTEYNTQNAIDIKKVGLYKVDYFINFTPSEDINYSIFIKTDSSILAGSDVSKSVKAKEATYLYGSVIGMFAIDEFVSLYIKTNKDVNLSFGDTTGAKISIIKLD